MNIFKSFVQTKYSSASDKTMSWKKITISWIQKENRSIKHSIYLYIKKKKSNLYIEFFRAENVSIAIPWEPIETNHIWNVLHYGKKPDYPFYNKNSSLAIDTPKWHSSKSGVSSQT